MAYNLLDLPHEVLHSVLVNTNPADLGRLCCCRTLNDFLKNDRLLYKELYLRHFDGLLQDPDAELPWVSELKKLVKVQKILESNDADMKSDNIVTVSQSVQDLLTTAAIGSEPSLNVRFLTTLFEPQQNKDIFLCGSFLFGWAKEESWGTLATSRLRRDIVSMFTTFESDRSLVEPADLEAARSAIVTLNETTALAHVNINDSKAPTCQSNFPPKDPDNEGIGHRIIIEPASIAQLSAKVHCLYGISLDTVRKDSAISPRYCLRSDTISIHPYARSRVYDLRQHTENSYWGPYLDDGSYDVDWEKMEAIMILLDHNMKLSKRDHHEFQGMIDVQDTPFTGAIPNSFISPASSLPMQPALPLKAQDPYSVTGTWTRVVCFLDYSELYDFNFSDNETPDDDQPRRPIDTQEAIRLIEMRIHVTKIEAPGEEDGQRLPIVHFRGSSSATRPHWDPNANSLIKGTVRLTPQGEVRWTTFSVYHGEERWRSEGIQVGGVRSARGVLGYWFDKDHDIHGPAGPTAFWKSHDGIEEKKTMPTTGHGVQLFTLPLY